MEAIFEQLNEAQSEAVRQIDGPLLILAGAGSGKTKTITTRLAFLLDVCGIPPSQTLTLTFTNKAAREMRERALSLITQRSYPPLLCTFHKFGLLFLKFHIQKLGRANDFVVIDTDDKKRMLKRLSGDLNTGMVAAEISRYKNSLLSPADALAQAESKHYEQLANVYKEYEQNLQEGNLVDFDDLLALPYRLMEAFPELSEETSRRYQYIMIDEYQDTNALQFQLLQKLCSTHRNLCVVGDDDQSIYGWRGAHVRNILEFEQDFPSATVIRLEQNYRSRAPILDAANALIEHNRSRLGKRLEATRGDGEAVQVLDSSDENEEANKVATQIKKRMEQGARAEQIAVLYRINAMSRSLEDGLRRAGINYRLVGGVRFYERAEIKDLISYLRVITNPHDDFSIKRIINRPKRGIGKASLEKLEKEGYARSVSIYELLRTISDAELTAMVRKKSATALRQFITTIDDARDQAQASLYRFIDELETLFGLRAFYAATPEGDERIHNIDEFYGYFRDFVKLFPEASLDDFLNDVSLQSDQDEVEGESIYIMSIHASKGLEFDHLFIIGLEEGFLPLIGENNDIEEERRLGYVAFTRARETLCLSHVQSRYYNGRRTVLNKSRFIGEGGLCEGSLKVEKRAAFKKGDLVRHKIFGPGRVTGVNRDGREFLLTINFSGNVRNIVSTYVERL